MTAQFKHFIDPNIAILGDNTRQFLENLAQPTAIFLTGRDSSRCRALVTLLHGNEPSGVEALFRWLRSGMKPEVNLLCIIASVSAASIEPVFSHRMIAGQRDLNRCFKPPFTDEVEQLAQQILAILVEYQPEAIIDLHNTSGSGPAFAVAAGHHIQHQAFASLFSQRLIITDLRLGSLMELSQNPCPIVTIECGGRLDESAHQLAFEGIQKYFLADQVLEPQQCDFALDLLYNPVRLELKPDTSLTYALEPTESDVTLLADIEHLNSGIAHQGIQLGWIEPEICSLGDIFLAKNSRGEDVLDRIITAKGNQLYFSQDLILFMVTTDTRIAYTDCLFYASCINGNEIGLT